MTTPIEHNNFNANSSATTAAESLGMNISNNMPFSGKVKIDNYNGGFPFHLFQDLGQNPNEDFNKNSLINIIESNEVSTYFFLRSNIDKIQDLIKSEISRISNDKYNIGNQSEVSLQIIMRSIYLQHSKNLPNNIDEQVDTLNQKVLDYCIPNIITNIKQHVGYIRDINAPISIPPTPLDTRINNNQLQPDVGFTRFSK